MDPLTLGLIGAGVGLAKSELIDRPKEERQRKQAAITARWSPWTGMAPGAIQEADPFGSALTTGVTGAMLGQNQQAVDANKAKDVAEINLTGGTSPIGPYQTADEYTMSYAPLTLAPMQPTWAQMGPQPMQPMILASR